MAPEAGRQTANADAVWVERERDGHRRLVMTVPIASGEQIVRLRGVVRRTPTRYSIQIGRDRHLDDMGPVDATNHRCDPSAFIDFSDPERIVLRALRDLSVGDEVSIHYCATEYDMASPFDCHCGADGCLGRVRGYRYVSDEVALDLETWLSRRFAPFAADGSPHPITRVLRLHGLLAFRGATRSIPTVKSGPRTLPARCRRMILAR